VITFIGLRNHGFPCTGAESNRIFIIISISDRGDIVYVWKTNSSKAAICGFFPIGLEPF